MDFMDKLQECHLGDSRETWVMVGSESHIGIDWPSCWLVGLSSESLESLGAISLVIKSIEFWGRQPLVWIPLAM